MKKTLFAALLALAGFTFAQAPATDASAPAATEKKVEGKKKGKKAKGEKKAEGEKKAKKGKKAAAKADTAAAK